MNITKFREVIKKRTECHSEYYDGIEECWEEEIKILSEDVPSTIDFLKNECTASEYSWISEVIDDLAGITKSKELVNCYKELMTKFPEECETYNIAGCIQFAEEALGGGVTNGEET